MKKLLNRPRMLIIGVLLLVLLTASLILPNPSWAENLRSDSYVISFGNFNIASGEKSSASYNVTDTVGQTGAGPYGQYGVSGYFVGGGFQYIYQIQNFSFSISDLNINLGNLTVGNHNTDSHTITISTRGANGYAVYAYEIHPLKHTLATNIIPDTTCDSGLCDQTAAGIWTDTNIGGFGFNVSGDGVPTDFISNDHYRQFADDSTAEAMQVVMSSSNLARKDWATITYKAGIEGFEAAGTYNTAVVYVAVPGY